MMERVRVEKAIRGHSQREVFEFVLSVENYPRFMPNVNRVDVLEWKGNKRKTAWDTQIEGAPLLWSELDTIDAEHFKIAFDSVEGDFDTFRGWWEVVENDTQVLVACELEYSVGIAEIEQIVGPVLKEKIADNLRIMLNGIAKGIDDAALASSP